MVRTFAFSVALVVGVGVAHADDSGVNADHMQLALTRSPFIATEAAEAPTPWDWRGGIALNWINSPVVLQPPTGGRVEVVANRTILSFFGAFELGKYVGLGVEVPVVVQDSGSADVAHGPGLGDLRFVPRIEILNKSHIHLAGFLGLRAATGYNDSFSGENATVFEPRIAFQLHAGMFDFGSNFGIRLRQQITFDDLRVGNEIYLTLALAVQPKPWISVVLEVHGDTAMTSRFAKTRVSAVEILLGFIHAVEFP